MSNNTTDKFLINGKRTLNGEIEISTSKNATLPIMAASILTDEEVVIKNVPKFSDIDDMAEILNLIGASTKFEDGNLIIHSKNANNPVVLTNQASKVRSSIFMLGSLISRFKKAKVAMPGGCRIGARPIDIHLNGLRALGAKVIMRHGYVYASCENGLFGATIPMEFPSVGATENILFASVLAKGKSVIINAAKEPEIVDLANFLNKMGAKVTGAGTDKIEIVGVDKLHSVSHEPIKDRIIAATYLIAAAMTGGKVAIKNVEAKNLSNFILKMHKTSCQITTKYDRIELSSLGKLKAIPKLSTGPYPGFPTDLQSQMLVMQTTSSGTSIVEENLFENRFAIVPELYKMGAKITVTGNKAKVVGVDELYGSDVFGEDLRGTAGLVLAGLVASGYSTIHGIKYLDRGYFEMERTLNELGADICRQKETLL